MYTQCSHCRAVFRVTMKELTAAQGLLRCSECDTIFDAMKALSTTLPEERAFAGTPKTPLTPDSTAVKTPTQNSKAGATHKASSAHTKSAFAKPAARSRKFLYFSLTALFLLLILQLLYSFRHTFKDHPIATQLSHSICNIVGCQPEISRDLEQIKMLSHNVYSHPNSPNVLIISTSIQNNANFPQPYPLLEVSFLNSAAEIVSLRRFTPAEYLGTEQADNLMPQSTPQEFSINIADPGKDAVRFQFRFL